MADHRAEEVLRFWFDPALDAKERSKRWFTKDAAFDAEIRRRFLPLHEAAAAGRLPGWQADPRECLALVVVLDQFPRNMFRGGPRAFATDELAREAARALLPRAGELSADERLFAYLPFEHSESLADQDLTCELMRDFDADLLRYALRHREIIARFGRFPHRNAILGRESTPEEMEFLKQPGSGF
ncbi:MAG TPA: DUF924 family protein [Burkholderiales bacterium]|jgi:uncharacterized protein (DUF924 family)